MQTITHFLETLFQNLPKSPEVLRAKEELAAMMEDKYHELKAEGKTENEAVGIVISEFGNFEELAYELGIQEFLHETKEKRQVGRYISFDEAKEYISVNNKSSYRIGLGVVLCIMSPVLLILLDGLAQSGMKISEDLASAVGVIVLFLVVACAVGIFIINGILLQKFQYLQKDMIKLDLSTESYIRNERQKFNPRFAVYIAVGVILCITSVIPIIITDAIFGDDNFFQYVAIACLFIMISIAVFLFIVVVMRNNSYKILLQEEEYGREKKKDTLTDAVSSVYWSLVTCIYIGYSLFTFDWSRSWIIWPVAGVLFGAVLTICKSIHKKEW